MNVTHYNAIALNWQPDEKDTRSFYLIIVAALVVSLVLAIVLQSITVPESARKKAVVPDRVAQFIKTKPKPPKPVVPPKAKPKPPPPPPPPPKTVVERKKPKEVKPLTESQKKARKTAEQTGILALSNEFADLIDSSSVDQAVAGAIKSGNGAQAKAAGINADALIKGATKGSGGINSADVVASVGTSQLSQAELAQVQTSLIKGSATKEDDKKSDASVAKQGRGDNVRSEEEVVLIFDQNKGRLQSLYLRERRKSPSLQGKIVFEITISPAGKVTNVRIVSSELNNASLERRLVSRIKSFSFGNKSVEPVTVTFPIDFLP